MPRANGHSNQSTSIRRVVVDLDILIIDRTALAGEDPSALDVVVRQRLARGHRDVPRFLECHAAATIAVEAELGGLGTALSADSKRGVAGVLGHPCYSVL